MKTHNPYIAMAMLATLAATWPPVRTARRKVEYKDLGGEVAAALKEIQSGIAALGDRLAASEKSVTELKSLDGTVKALQADLAEARKEVAGRPELKSFDDKFAGFGGRLDEFERKINNAVIASAPKGKKGKKSFGLNEELNKAMRSGQNIEVKSLDSDLKQQDIFHDVVVVSDFPLVDLAYRRPTTADLPKYSYPTGAVVTIKGEEAGTANSRKKVELSVVNYQYQPTLDRDDVNDTGSFMLDDESANMVEGTRERLNADLVNAIEAAGNTTVTGDDVYIKVKIIAAATPGTLTDSDLNALVTALAKKYQRGAVILGNAAMTATVKGLRDATTGVSLWQPSIAAGTPATLKGFTYLEDANVANGRLILANPLRGMAIMEREAPTLSNIERLNGDYKPYFAARYGRGVTDARAIKIMDVGTAGS